MRRWLTAIVFGGACAAWPLASAARGTRAEAWGGARLPTLLSLRLDLPALARPPEPGLLLDEPRAWRLAPPGDLWSFAPVIRDVRERRGPSTSASRRPLGTIFDAIVLPRADTLAVADDVAPLPVTADWRQAAQLSFALAP